jgi:hypothetical protein
MNKQRFRLSWVPVEQTAAPTALGSVENVSLNISTGEAPVDAVFWLCIRARL